MACSSLYLHMVYLLFLYCDVGSKGFCPLVSLNSLYYETDLFICQEENVYFTYFLYIIHIICILCTSKHSLSIFPLSRLSPGALVTADFCSLSMKISHIRHHAFCGRILFSYRFISILLLHFFSCRHFLFLHNTFECGGQTCQSLQIGRNNNLCCLSVCQNTKCLKAL